MKYKGEILAVEIWSCEYSISRKKLRILCRQLSDRFITEFIDDNDIVSDLNKYEFDGFVMTVRAMHVNMSSTNTRLGCIMRWLSNDIKTKNNAYMCKAH
jgi:hypothetical protein